MITYSDYKKIQDMKAKGYNGNQTYQKLGVTQYHTYKFWDMAEDDFLEYSEIKNEKFGKYKGFIADLIKQSPEIKSTTIWDRLYENFGKIDSSKSQFYKYMKKIRIQQGFIYDYVKRKHSPMESPPGEQAQVDLGQTTLYDIYGNKVKVYFFCMILSFSRMKYVYFSCESFDSIRFVYAHELAFQYFRGRTIIIMYDQDRVMVVGENAGDVVFTSEFEEYKRMVGFDVFLCKKNDPATKGKIERVVQYVKANFLDGRVYSGIDSLNSSCLAWLDRTGNGLAHRVTKKPPRELFEIERKHLVYVTPRKIDLYKQRIVRVQETGVVLYKKNRYALPQNTYKIGEYVRLEKVGELLQIVDPETNVLIVTHKLVDGSGKLATHEVAKKHPDAILELTKELFNNNVVNRFMDKMALDKPRYIREQCRMFSKMLAEYRDIEIIDAVKACTRRKKFCATDVLACLIKKYGTQKAENIIPNGTHSHYERKANNLTKYNSLLEE